jgi:hypothetical protein
MQQHLNQTFEAFFLEIKGNRRTTGLKVEEAEFGSFSVLMSANFEIEGPSPYLVTDSHETWGRSSERIIKNDKLCVTNFKMSTCMSICVFIWLLIYVSTCVSLFLIKISLLVEMFELGAPQKGTIILRFLDKSGFVLTILTKISTQQNLDKKISILKISIKKSQF